MYCNVQISQSRDKDTVCLLHAPHSVITTNTDANAWCHLNVSCRYEYNIHR